jgi:two-component system, response regulator
MKNLNPVDILIVEDNPNDAELTVRALKKQNLANSFLLLRMERRHWILSIVKESLASVARVIL